MKFKLLALIFFFISHVVFGMQQKQEKPKKDSIMYLYIIDGKRKLSSTLDISKLVDPSLILSVEMIQDSVKKKEYGKEGKNAVIIIKTKKTK